MSVKKSESRRHFLRETAAAGLAMASLKGIAPPHVLGANETVRLGVIGTGGRGQWGMAEAKKRGAKIVAVCDVYEARQEQGRQLSATDDGHMADGYYEH